MLFYARMDPKDGGLHDSDGSLGRMKSARQGEGQTEPEPEPEPGPEASRDRWEANLHHCIDCLVVRTMKADRAHSFTSLIETVTGRLPVCVAKPSTEDDSRTAAVLRKMVRRRVDNLIVREYIERDQWDMNQLRYLP
eukprot:COSAG04_NODE_16846_length_487_cov_0.899485_1_plen_137_part_00